MKSSKTFTSPFANMVPVTNVKNDLLDLRRLAKVLNMVADKADNKNPKRDDEVLVASMYPQVPHITYGMVRAAMEEVDMIEESHREAAMVMPTGRRLKEMGKDFSLPADSKHRNRLPKYKSPKKNIFPGFETAKKAIGHMDK